MTSMLPEEDTKIAKMKEKLMNDVHGKEESRSFLSFSRENLSISQSELEKGFNKYRFRPTRNTILSIAALSIAFLCLALESWKFHWTMVNAREIEELKRSMENLKHRFLEKDFLDEVKAFEEQLYAEETDDDDDDDDDGDGEDKDNDNDNDNDDEDPGEVDIDNADYDSNYDEDKISSHDYSSDYQATGLRYGARPSDFQDFSSTIAPVPSPPEPTSNKAMIKWLSTMRKFEMRHDSKKNSQEGARRKVDRDHRYREDRTNKLTEAKSDNGKNNTKEKRDVLKREGANDLWPDWRTNSKRKRSIEQERDSSDKLVVSNRNRTFGVSGPLGDRVVPIGGIKLLSIRPIPPKKYYTRSSDAFSAPVRNREDSSVGSVGNLKRRSRKLRKNLHAPRQIFAVHYGGDKNGFTDKDEHTGNGRIRHAGKVFTSWKANNWVQDLGMNEHFRLLKNGSVIVYKSGLYLAYAQIHYKDEHDEVGFHLLVNNEPILQCVIDNSGSTHVNSQSCFSARVTMLNKDDIVLLKEIGSPKFALFNEEKSFFGLVKLGEFHAPKKSALPQL